MHQLDLFKDNPKTIAARQLAEALSARDVERGRAGIQRLAGLDPYHEWVRHAETLVAVMEAPDPSGQEQGFEWIRCLERDWRPAAEAVLGPDGSEDFLASAWRRVARAIKAAPFDPSRPERHKSWACLQARDWEGVRRSVREVEGHETAPVLLARLAEAESRSNHRAQAVDHWFTLCWQAPAYFERIVEEPSFPDEALADAWRVAQDSDVEQEWSPEWFPAWVLLEEPELAKKCASRGGTDAARRTFEIVRSLLTTRQQDSSNLSLRRDLKALHPGLLGVFLSKYA